MSVEAEAARMKVTAVMMILILSIIAPVIKLIVSLLQERGDRLFHLSNQHIKDT